MNIFEFTIAAEYIPYITKGDVALFGWAGGVELKQEIDAWMNKNKKKLGAGRYIPIKENNEIAGEFTACDITGEYAFCINVGYLVI